MTTPTRAAQVLRPRIDWTAKTAEETAALRGLLKGVIYAADAGATALEIGAHLQIELAALRQHEEETTFAAIEAEGCPRCAEPSCGGSVHCTAEPYADEDRAPLGA